MKLERVFFRGMMKAKMNSLSEKWDKEEKWTKRNETLSTKWYQEMIAVLPYYSQDNLSPQN